MKKRVLVTGAAGFYGSSFIRYLMRHTDWDVVALSRPSFGGTYERFNDVGFELGFMSRVKFLWHDLRSPISDLLAKQIGAIDYIFHIGASSHVDRSIEDPVSFMMDNGVGTTHALDYARKNGVQKFFYFSTDEVFGSAAEGQDFKEWDRYKSGNPYAAAKAAGEEMVQAFDNTYGLFTVTTHTMNLFGPYQHPEKFIPKTIRHVLDQEVLPIHSNRDKTKAGSRKYIHVDNVSGALLYLVEHGEKGEKYNIVGEVELDNLSLAQMIADILGKPLQYEMVDFHSSRPGHDLRYSLDGSKMKELGYSFVSNFDQSLQDTVQWYMNNRGWL